MKKVKKIGEKYEQVLQSIKNDAIDIGDLCGAELGEEHLNVLLENLK